VIGSRGCELSSELIPCLDSFPDDAFLKEKKIVTEVDDVSMEAGKERSDLFKESYFEPDFELSVNLSVENVAHLSVNKNFFNVKQSDLRLKNLIGEGDTSVYFAEWKSQEVAVKFFTIRQLDKETFAAFENEVKIQLSLHHANVLRFVGATCILEENKVGFLMEVCKNGDLEHFIKMFKMKNNGVKYSFSKKMRMLKEVASAMKYLHSLKVIHRDLKPANVLVTSDEETRVMNFGLSKLALDTGMTQKGRVGTSVYMAPEVLSGNYNEKVDVFSFGILMYVVLTEKWMPYGEEKSGNGDEMRAKSDPKFRPDISVVADDGNIQRHQRIIQMMWDHDAKVRPSFEGILLSDFHGIEILDGLMQETYKEKEGVNTFFCDEGTCDFSNEQFTKITAAKPASLDNLDTEIIFFDGNDNQKEAVLPTSDLVVLPSLKADVPSHVISLICVFFQSDFPSLCEVTVREGKKYEFLKEFLSLMSELKKGKCCSASKFWSSFCSTYRKEFCADGVCDPAFFFSFFTGQLAGLYINNRIAIDVNLSCGFSFAASESMKCPHCNITISNTPEFHLVRLSTNSSSINSDSLFTTRTFSELITEEFRQKTKRSFCEKTNDKDGDEIGCDKFVEMFCEKKISVSSNVNCFVLNRYQTSNELVNFNLLEDVQKKALDWLRGKNLDISKEYKDDQRRFLQKVWPRSKDDVLFAGFSPLPNSVLKKWEYLTCTKDEVNVSVYIGDEREKMICLGNGLKGRCIGMICHDGERLDGGVYFSYLVKGGKLFKCSEGNVEHVEQPKDGVVTSRNGYMYFFCPVIGKVGKKRRKNEI